MLTLLERIHESVARDDRDRPPQTFKSFEP
ncbi:MAG: hypothetical protein ACJAVK_001120 [Akkermansiaceae bacterium]